MTKRKNSLAGSHLYQHQNGHYYWRRKDPRTGERRPVDCGIRLDLAIKRAAELDREFEARVEGRPTADAWDLDVGPLVQRWLRIQQDAVESDRTYQNKKMRIERVVRLLGLARLRDLRALASIDDRLRALENDEGESVQNIRRGYQEPLRQFSAWLAENNRILDLDPLANWKPIEFERVPDSRGSLLPLTYAGALVALDYMAKEHGFAVGQRPLFTTLLVVGARAGALTSREVRHLDQAGSRLDLGASVGKKRRGAAALDAATLDEVARAAHGRPGTDPLFRAARGGAHDPARARDLWDQAVSLALVDELWPATAPRDLGVVHRVSRSLLAGALQVGVEGSPRGMTDARTGRIENLRSSVGELVEILRPDWTERNKGLVLASIRKTHHTWARALGVPPPCIDKQLGHASHDADGLDVMNAVVGSRTGTRHYLDMRSSLIDPAQSAQAVRDRLDEAEAEFRSSKRFLLAEWARSLSGVAGASAS